jgi:bifunctional UDP-N-acetylglucosamine pyrophosphorylase/glucosamine-1-phosphate N-acetyltransferase
MFALLNRVGNDNAQGEYYLPDMVMVALSDGRHCAVIECDDWQVAGVNSRAELAQVERDWQDRRREAAMAGGATLIAPETVWFAADTQIGRDVLIEPNVFFGLGVSVADNVTIKANCHIEGASLASGVSVGPFARLRPGAVLEENSKIGNFVEMKKAILGKGAKASHLTYLGDAEVGANANIGAGTITCNYDGYFKYKTKIGEGAFIGSNSALIAPVTIGKGAIVAAGSAVTKDIADGALGIVRAQQAEKDDWASRFNTAMQKKKEQKS